MEKRRKKNFFDPSRAGGQQDVRDHAGGFPQKKITAIFLHFDFNFFSGSSPAGRGALQALRLQEEGDGGFHEK